MVEFETVIALLLEKLRDRRWTLARPALSGLYFAKRLPKSGKMLLAPVAQGIEHSFPKAGVAGSNPAGGARFELMSLFKTSFFPNEQA